MEFSGSSGEWTIEIKVYAWHIDLFITKLSAETARKRLVDTPDLRLVATVHQTHKKTVFGVSRLRIRLHRVYFVHFTPATIKGSQKEPFFISSPQSRTSLAAVLHS